MAETLDPNIRCALCAARNAKKWLRDVGTRSLISILIDRSPLVLAGIVAAYALGLLTVEWLEMHVIAGPLLILAAIICFFGAVFYGMDKLSSLQRYWRSHELKRTKTAAEYLASAALVVWLAGSLLIVGGLIVMRTLNMPPPTLLTTGNLSDALYVFYDSGIMADLLIGAKYLSDYLGKYDVQTAGLPVRSVLKGFGFIVRKIGQC